MVYSSYPVLLTTVLVFVSATTTTTAFVVPITTSKRHHWQGYRYHDDDNGGAVRSTTEIQQQEQQQRLYAMTNSQNWDILLSSERGEGNDEDDDEENDDDAERSRRHPDPARAAASASAARYAATHRGTKDTATQAAAATAMQIDNLVAQWDEVERWNEQHTTTVRDDDEMGKRYQEHPRHRHYHREQRSSDPSQVANGSFPPRRDTLIDMSTQWTRRNAETTFSSNSEHVTVKPRQKLSAVSPRPVGIPPRRDRRTTTTVSAASATTAPDPLTPTTTTAPTTTSTTTTGPVLEYRFDDLDTLDHVREQAANEILPTTNDLLNEWEHEKEQKNRYQYDPQGPQEEEGTTMKQQRQQQHEVSTTTTTTTTSMLDLAAQWTQRNREHTTRQVEPSFPPWDASPVPPPLNQRESYTVPQDPLASSPAKATKANACTDTLAAEWAQRNQDVVDRSSGMPPPITASNSFGRTATDAKPPSTVLGTSQPPKTTSTTTMDSLAQQWKSRNADDDTTTTTTTAQTANRITYDMRGVVLSESQSLSQQVETGQDEGDTVIMEDEIIMEEKEQEGGEEHTMMSSTYEQVFCDEEEEQDEEEEEEDDNHIVSSTQIDSFVDKVKAFTSFPVERISLKDKEDDVTENEIVATDHQVSEQEALKLVNQVEIMLGESNGKANHHHDDDSIKELEEREEIISAVWNRKIADALPTKKFAFTMKNFDSSVDKGTIPKHHEWLDAVAKLKPAFAAKDSLKTRKLFAGAAATLLASFAGLAMLSSSPHIDASSSVDVRATNKSPVKGGPSDNVMMKSPAADKKATESDAFKPVMRGDESLLHKSVEPQGNTVVTPSTTTTEPTTTPEVVTAPAGIIADVDVPQATASPSGIVDDEAIGVMPPVDQTLRDLTEEDLRDIPY